MTAKKLALLHTSPVLAPLFASLCAKWMPQTRIFPHGRREPGSKTPSRPGISAESHHPAAHRDDRIWVSMPARMPCS